MALETIPFDAAKNLETQADQAEYLTDVRAAGDPAAFAHSIGVVARARGMSTVSRGAGVQRANLYRALSKDGHPEMATIIKVVQSLGLRLAVLPAEQAKAI